jgi:Rad3-related DNA helicase
LGKELNVWALRSWISRNYESEGVPSGLLQQILLGIGAARSNHPLIEGLQKVLESTAEEICKLRETSDEFFQRLTDKAKDKVPQKENNYTQKLRLREPDQFILELGAAGETLTHSLAEIARKMSIIRETLGDIPSDVLPQVEDWLDDLRGASDELLDILETLKFFQQPADEDWVYWTEIPSRRDAAAVLYAAPLNAGDILRLQLFDPLRAGVLTSATLTVSGRFHYFLRKVGLQDTDSTRTLKLGSPFAFQDQMLIALPAFLPSPKSPDFETQSAELICDLVETLNCGTLGLFTSYKMLTFVAENLRKRSAGRRILVQGQNGSRDSLLSRFRREPDSVLLGTDSFWEGIDVVGEALELLLVAKLPFEVPSEPIVEARLEKLKAEGKDPFMYYTVPEAVIRLRQGIGRLIRSKTDRGAALILDSRLTNSRYAGAFTTSLPTEMKRFQTKEDLLSTLQLFLAKSKRKPRSQREEDTSYRRRRIRSG